MSRKKFALSPLASEILDVMREILAVHYLGFDVLSGSVEMPEPDELAECGVDAARMFRTLATIGGVDAIARAIERMRINEPESWQFLRDACRVRRGRPHLFGHDASLAALGSRYGLSVGTITRNKIYLLERLAAELARECVGDDSERLE